MYTKKNECNLQNFFLLKFSFQEINLKMVKIKSALFRLKLDSSLLGQMWE